jgi:subtilisin family serine protease
MLLVDADELALIISASAGETLAWAFYAALASLAIGWIIGGIALAAKQFQAGRRLNNRPIIFLLGAATLITCVAGGLVYYTAGQPGFYGEGLFVVLKDQADVTNAASIANYQERRQYVYNTLVAHADSTQAELRQAFDRLGLEYTPYYLVNAIQVNGGPLLRLWLLTRPEVDRVLDNPWLRPLPAPPPISPGSITSIQGPDWNLTTIGADRVWDELGITGQGIVVGQSDSGVQGDHPELAASYRGQGGQNDYNWYDPWNGTTQPTDIGGHGTHTLGTILGRNTGVAPGATWYGCVNLARNLGNPALYLDCMQFMLAPFQQNGDPLHAGDPARGAHVINNSWGCPEIEGCDANSLLYAVRNLRAAGVFVVASAGNDGPGCNTLNAPPALYDEAFSVGAIDSFGQIAPFSSIGPVTADGSQRTKPDIVAPGVDVLSSTPGSTYASYSGTSMAGPHMVGVVALMWSANPALIGDIERTEQILVETAQPYTGTLPDCPGANQMPSTVTGYGVVDAYNAVKTALQP